MTELQQICKNDIERFNTAQWDAYSSALNVLKEALGDNDVYEFDTDDIYCPWFNKYEYVARLERCPDGAIAIVSEGGDGKFCDYFEDCDLLFDVASYLCNLD